MDELKIPTTAREIRDISFEEMNTIMKKFEREKERRRKAEVVTNVTNKIFDAICEAQALGFRIILTVADDRTHVEFSDTIESSNTISIKVTR